MIFDGHIHIHSGEINLGRLKASMKEANVDGGTLLSIPPASFPVLAKEGARREFEFRIENLLEWCEGENRFYPMFWIDPMEDDVPDQVGRAVEAGVAGFKVICDRYFPGDKKARRVFSAIAETRKPLMFHSGILWDGKDSSRYNRPAEFEALLDIRGLRFSLAHIGWPWTDECLAVYGKYLNAYAINPEVSAEMFIDVTPGTPPIYRKEVFEKMFGIGYNIERNVFFGTDSRAEQYNANWVKEWIDRDSSIYRSLRMRDETIEDLFSGNARRFLGLGDQTGDYIPPLPAE